MCGNAAPSMAKSPVLDLVHLPMHLRSCINETGCLVKRLLLVLSFAFTAMLLTSGLAGSAQAHGGAHEMQAEFTDHVPADPIGGQQQPCHCQGSMHCVQLIEAAQPLLRILDQQLRTVRMIFEPSLERSEFVPTDPPPPRV